MKFCDKSHHDILSAIKEAASRYITTEDKSEITDIHFLPKQENGELIIFNDDDKVLSRVVVAEWVENDSPTFYEEVEKSLRLILEELKTEGLLDKLCLIKPYSFVLVDDDKETVAELMLVDDADTLLLNDELLKGLDEELDAFLEDLLEK